MSITLIGQCINPEGLSRRSRDGQDLYNWVTLAPTQPHLPLMVDHNPALTIGQVVYVESDPRSGTTIVATIDDDRYDLGHRHHLSISMDADQATAVEWASMLTVATRCDGARLREVSLVERPAAVVNPVVLSRIDVRHHRGGHPNDMPGHYRRTLDRAHDYHRTHRYARSLDVVTPDPTAITDAAIERDRYERRQRQLTEALSTTGQVHYRHNSGRIAAIR